MALFEPAPYQTAIFTDDNRRTLSTQWVRWLQGILTTIVVLAEDTTSDTDVLLGINGSDSASAINDLQKDIVTLVNNNDNTSQILDSINEICTKIIQYDNTQFLLDKVSDLQNNVPILATTQPIITTTIDLPLDNTHYHVLCDASSNTIDITLPDCTLIEGKEYVVHGYDATNTINVLTTASQQIRNISTDVATNKNIASGDVVYFVSTGIFWKLA